MSEPKEITNPFQALFDQMQSLHSELAGLRKEVAKLQGSDAGNEDKVPVAEVLKAKKISRSTFYRLVSSGQVSVFKLGSKSFVSRREMDALFIRAEV